jgi:hypothetical protein
METTRKVQDMTDGKWMFAEESSLAPADLDKTVRVAGGYYSDDPVRGPGLPRLSIKLREVICRDVHKMFASADAPKWLGGAQVRLDALVVYGKVADQDLGSFYMPGTFRFPDVRDDVPLPIDKNFGLLIFDGSPAFFLDVFIMASRDRKDTDDLASLLKGQLTDPKVQAAATSLLTLAAAVPTAAAIVAAVGAAATLGDVAYKVVKAVSPTTIGLYRGSFLQFGDGFGIGRHPSRDSTYFEGDLRFWFETVRNEDPNAV